MFIIKSLSSLVSQINDVQIQERVMDELKSLHLYMHGKGFRRNARMTEEKHGISWILAYNVLCQFSAWSL